MRKRELHRRLGLVSERDLACLVLSARRMSRRRPTTAPARANPADATTWTESVFSRLPTSPNSHAFSGAIREKVSA
ncbi:MAG TPA: hypothetical protein VMK12_25500, partial [Anaeromyxobacteraceae bacterium]|nr:hypothetical protein [Anaeromyxobacteraceae bacterium]